MHVAGGDAAEFINLVCVASFLWAIYKSFKRLIKGSDGASECKQCGRKYDPKGISQKYCTILGFCGKACEMLYKREHS